MIRLNGSFCVEAFFNDWYSVECQNDDVHDRRVPIEFGIVCLKSVISDNRQRHPHFFRSFAF